MSDATHITDPHALRAALEAVCDLRDATVVQARIVMRDAPTIVVTACGPARSIDGAREVEIARSLAPALGEAMMKFVQSVKDTELQALRDAVEREVTTPDGDPADRFSPGAMERLRAAVRRG